MSEVSATAHDRDPVRAFVGLGSNLDQPLEQVRRAIAALDRLSCTTVLAYSSLYGNAAIGPGSQPDFVNAVVELETELTPHELLDGLQGLEAAQGRARGRLRWAARTLDLDLLLYGDQQVSTDRLVVPHPGLTQRSFVLEPLREIDDSLNIPGAGRVSDLVAGLIGHPLTRMAPGRRCTQRNRERMQ